MGKDLYSNRPDPCGKYNAIPAMNHGVVVTEDTSGDIAVCFDCKTASHTLWISRDLFHHLEVSRVNSSMPISTNLSCRRYADRSSRHHRKGVQNRNGLSQI